MQAYAGLCRLMQGSKYAGRPPDIRRPARLYSFTQTYAGLCRLYTGLEGMQAGRLGTLALGEWQVIRIEISLSYRNQKTSICFYTVAALIFPQTHT